MSDAAPRRYRSKPIVVEAIHYAADGSNNYAVRNWLKEHGALDTYASHINHRIHIHLPDATMMHTSPDDWIICDAIGVFHTCLPDIFVANYEAAS